TRSQGVPPARRRAQRAVRDGLRGRRVPTSGRAAPRRNARGVVQQRGESMPSRSRRPEEARETTRLRLLNGDGALHPAGLIPHAEPHLRILVEVTRDAQCLPRVTRMGGEELDELASQRRGAPWAVAKPLLDA